MSDLSTTPPDGLDAELLDRYLAGQCSVDEQGLVNRWLDREPVRAETVAALRQALGGNPTRPEVTDAIWQELMQHRGVDRRNALERGALGLKGAVARRSVSYAGRGGGLGRKTLRGWGRYAVVGMAFTTLSVIAVVSIKNRGKASTARPVRSYTTTAGQQATVTLGDGSQALLGPATTLSIITQPSDASVDVRVVGQAVFTLQKSQVRPFRVHVGHAVARVLGTTFMVRRYDADLVTSIVVTSGRVSLNAIRDTAIIEGGRVLTAGTLGTVDDSGRVHVTPTIAVDDYTGWTRGQLVFHRTPVRDVVLELGRAYGADIRVPDSTLAVQPIDWTVLIGHHSLTGVLEFLAGVLDAHIARVNRVIILEPGPSASRRPSGLSPLHPPESEHNYGR